MEAKTNRVSFSFLPKGGGGGKEQNEIAWIIGGQVCICVQSMWQSRGCGGMLIQEILVLELCNLVESGTVFSQT